MSDELDTRLRAAYDGLPRSERLRYGARERGVPRGRAAPTAPNRAQTCAHARTRSARRRRGVRRRLRGRVERLQPRAARAEGAAERGAWLPAGRRVGRRRHRYHRPAAGAHRGRRQHPTQRRGPFAAGATARDRAAPWPERRALLRGLLPGRRDPGEATAPAPAASAGGRDRLLRRHAPRGLDSAAAGPRVRLRCRCARCSSDRPPRRQGSSPQLRCSSGAWSCRGVPRCAAAGHG